MEFGLLTIQDVCKILKVSQRTIRGRIADGTFCPAIRIGRLLRWKDTTLQDWLEQQEGEVVSYERKKNKRFLNEINNLIKGGK